MFQSKVGACRGGGFGLGWFRVYGLGLVSFLGLLRTSSMASRFGFKVQSQRFTVGVHLVASVTTLGCHT